MAIVGTAIIDVKADTTQLVKGMSRAQTSVKNTVSNIKKTLVTMAVAYAGVNGIKAFSGMISDSIEAADATGKLAQKLGLATDKLSEYQYAAKFAGISNGELNAGFGALIRRLNNFQENGGGAAKDAFMALGISAKYARENFTSTDIAFEEILKRLEKMPDGFKKTAIAQDIFSKSASGVMQLTATDLAKYSEEARKLGFSISDSTAKMAADYNDQMDSMSARIEGMKQSIGFGIIAPMNAASKTALDFMNASFGTDATNKMQTYEDVAVTAIGNIVYSIGFIKDSFTGIELVMKGIEIGFYALGSVLALAFEPARIMINGMIETYNYLAETVGKDTIDFKLVSSIPDNIQKIKNLSDEIVTLSGSINNGRESSDEFMKKFKANLIQIKEEAKKTSVEVKNISSTSPVDNSIYDTMLEESIFMQEYQDAQDKVNAKFKERLSLENDWKTVLDSNYLSMLDSQISLVDSTNTWNDSLDGTSNNIMNISKSFSKFRLDELKATKAQAVLDKKYDADKTKYKNHPGKLAILEKNYMKESQATKKQATQNEMQGYAQLAGAMSNMFEQGSREAAAFQVIQSGIAIVSGITAVLSQGKGDPYTAFARMAAMAASVSVFLSSAGIAFGGSASTSTSYDSLSAQAANDGTGSVLGDASAQSESMKNSLSILEDFAKPEYALMSQMANSLKSIEYALAGVSANIVKTGNFSVGKGFAPTNNYTKGLGDDLNTFIGKTDFGANVFNQLDLSYLNDFDIGGKLVNTIVSGVFGGGTSTSTSLADAGLSFSSQLLNDALNSLSGREYQTIKTVQKTDGGWFKGDSTSISYSSQFKTLDSEIKSQFELILSSLYDTMIYSADSLGTATSSVENELSDFYVNIGKISLQGKSGDQIQESLTAIFGKVGDDMAREAFPALNDFQKIGEGMYETLTRVSVGMQEADYYISKLGFASIEFSEIVNKQGIVSLEALKQSIVSYEDTLYSSNNGVVDIINYLSSSSSDLFDTYKGLVDIRKQIIFIGQDYSAVTSDLLLGADGIDNLQSSLDNYFSSFLTQAEQTQYATQYMTDEFSKLGLQLPASALEYRQLVEGIDASDSSGQELLGRVLSLSDGFAQLSDDIATSTDGLSTYADNLLFTNLSVTNNLNSTMSLFNQSIADYVNAYDKKAASDNIKNYASNAVSYIGNSSLSLSEQQYETAVIANRIKEVSATQSLGSFRTVEDKIAEQTVAIVAKLDEIRTNTDKEYVA